MRLLCLLFLVVIFAHGCFFMQPSGNSTVVLDPTGINLTVTWTQIRDFSQQLSRTTQDAPYFHWASFEYCARYSVYGVTQKDMDYLTSPNNTKWEAAGGGVYVATTITGSDGFGPAVIWFTVPNNTMLYNETLAQDVFGLDFSMQAKVDLGKIIPFLHCYTSEWCVSHNIEILQRVNEPYPQSMSDMAKQMPYTPSKFKTALAQWSNVLIGANNISNVNVFKHNLNLCAHFLPLLSQVDGIYVLMASQINPEAPWAVLQELNITTIDIERYSKVMSQITLDSLFAYKSTFGPYGIHKEAWGKFITDEFLPELIANLTGTNQTDDIYRDFQQTSGDNAGVLGAWRVISEQLKYLEQNPYFDTHSIRDNSTGDYLAFFYYPDGSHYKQIVAAQPYALPQELIQNLENGTNANFTSNTHQLVKTLVTTFFQGLFNKDTSDTIDTQNLISLQPFRAEISSREIMKLVVSVLTSDNYQLSYNMIPDLQIMTSPSLFSQVQFSTTNGYTNMLTALFDRIYADTFFYRKNITMASIISSPEWKDLFRTSMQPFFQDVQSMNTTFTDAQLDMIKSHRFVDLFNSLTGGAKWGDSFFESDCTQIYDCQECITSSMCGWCGTENRCVRGGPAGPANSTCSNWQITSCAAKPVDPCSLQTDCQSCAQQGNCGWCQSTNTCMSGDTSKPNSGTCQVWMFQACPNNCSSIVDEFACPDMSYCGWCEQNKSCMAGGNKGPYLGYCPQDLWVTYQI